MENFKTTQQSNPEAPTQKQEVGQPSQSTPEQGAGILSSKTEEAFVEAKEERTTFLRRKILKIREYFGMSNQEDFDELLSLDFQEQLRDNPPIERVFSPEKELAGIKGLSKEQRKEALATFKENLVRQRKALAACRVFVERSIGFNHDVPREKLILLIEKFGEQYGFTEEQKQIAGELIDGYFTNRQRALETRQRFPDNTDLVNELTGMKFDRSEKLDVSVGPMTIDIDTEGFNAGRIYEKSEKPVIGFRSGGFASQSVGENPVYYVVINQDRYIRKNLFNDPSGEKTRKHEHEHQKNDLFRVVFERQLKMGPLKDLWFDYNLEQDVEIKKVILEELFAQRRAEALERVKDEFTASLYDRDLPTLQRQLEYFFFNKEGPYDYLKHLRNLETKKDDVLYQETAQKILVREYRMIIEKAVESYAELTRKGKYSTQEATALLTDKPLSDWPKTIRRLLEQK